MFTVERTLEWAATATKVANGVIPGVKILGFESPSHKRKYPIEVMKLNAHRYEGARVNFDHVKPGDRSSTQVFGRIRNARVDPERGLVGDLHYNPEHPYAKAVAWAAENDPTQYNLSHVADLIGSYDSDRWFVTKEIEKVHSVDVVSNGGTTSSLFESAASEGEPTVELTSMTREALQAARQDLKILTAAEAHTNEKSLGDAQTKILALEGEIATLKAKCDGLEAAEKLRVRSENRMKQIGEAKLPETLVTETFKSLALEASDERFTALLEERKTLAANQPASSRSKGVAESAGSPKTLDTKGFVSFLKGA